MTIRSSPKWWRVCPAPRICRILRTCTRELIAEDPEVQARIEEGEGEGFVPESLTQLVTLLPDQKAELDESLGDWRILPESDARRGDAVAAADASLVANEAFGDQTAGSYTVHDVFFTRR